MSEEQKESRVKIEDLPQNEQELTPEESKEVQGGLTAATQGRGLFCLSTSANKVGGVNNDGFDDIIVGSDAGASGGHVRVIDGLTQAGLDGSR